MSNALNADLTGKVVVLKPEFLKPAYRDLKWRLFLVEDGFGAKPYTHGQGLFGKFVMDAESARMEGYMVERFATEDDMPACEECGAEVLTMCDEFCSSRWS